MLVCAPSRLIGFLSRRWTCSRVRHCPARNCRKPNQFTQGLRAQLLGLCTPINVLNSISKLMVFVHASDCFQILIPRQWLPSIVDDPKIGLHHVKTNVHPATKNSLTFGSRLMGPVSCAFNGSTLVDLKYFHHNREFLALFTHVGDE